MIAKAGRYDWPINDRVADYQDIDSKASAMAHEIAKLLLEHADSIIERGEAIRTAMSLGMTLSEIEKYLDWLDVLAQLTEDEDEA